MKNKNLTIKDMVVAGAAVLGIIGIFLPWASLSAFGYTFSANGFDANGWICLIMFIAILGVTGYNIYKKINWAKICISIAAAIALIVAIINLADAAGSGVSVGFGLILVVITTLVCGIMPWVPLDKKPAKK